VRLDDVRGFVLDVDGTLVHRDGDDVHVLPGARELLERIRASGRPLALFTNGSHISPAGFAAGLRDAGLDVADDELLTPLSSVRTYLRTNDGATVLLFGTDAARQYLAASGIGVIQGDERGRVDAVLVAHTGVVDFGALERAARTILAGAPLLTGSYVPAYAGANGPIFSRGAMLTAALAKVTGRRPVVVGKPSRAAVRTMVERLGAPAAELAVIGDDLALDIALGRLGGSRTILVRSGISASVDLESVPERRRPDAAVDGVADLLDRL
jgi:HAD superfamily hydrolase (TIGR01450 family)